MTVPEDRLRPHPSTRLTGEAVALELPAMAQALRTEPHPARDGHRQTGLIHRGPLRLLLFTFDAGGALPQHKAPGYVVIHCLRGELVVDAAGQQHRVRTGAALVLNPDIPHDVKATVESDMLLTVCLPDTPVEQ